MAVEAFPEGILPPVEKGSEGARDLARQAKRGEMGGSDRGQGKRPGGEGSGGTIIDQVDPDPGHMAPKAALPTQGLHQDPSKLAHAPLVGRGRHLAAEVIGIFPADPRHL
jgi:hypothetical protein